MTWWLVPVALLAVLVALWLDLFVLYRHGRVHPSPYHHYEVVRHHWLPKLLGTTGAVTLRRRVFLAPNDQPPSAKGLAHEYGHVLYTHWLRYLWSKLVGGSYDEDQERTADAYARDNWAEFRNDAEMVEAWLQAYGDVT